MTAPIYKLIDAITDEILRDEQRISYLENEYVIITDQYMNGNIREPVGKYQNKLLRDIEKLKKRVKRNKLKLLKIESKFLD